MDQDLGLTENPDDYAFDELVGQIDYHLCAIKDVQIRDGLHVLSEAPTGEGWSTSSPRSCAPARSSGPLRRHSGAADRLGACRAREQQC